MKIKRVFFDINIVIDLMDKKRANFTNSLEALKFAILNDIEIVISEDMLSTIYYINKDKNYAIEFLEKIIKEWEVVAFGKEVISKALVFSKEKSCDLEDALQCFCAKYNLCDAIITNDKKFIDCGVKILTSKEFKEYLNE